VCALARRAPIAEALIKAIDTSTTVDNFLLAGEERVTLGADINMDILAQCRAGLDNIATATGGLDIRVFGMKFGLHDGKTPSFVAPPPGLLPGTAP
jgi:hypothetical protein